MTDHLTYGIEIECYLPGDMQSGANAVAARIGAPCEVITYRNAHLPCSTWKVVTDGSLGDYTHGAEFVSPILRGNDMRQVDQVCNALTDFGATVSQPRLNGELPRCGLHVHIGVADQANNLEFFKRLIRLYQAYEPVIDSFMPKSRRNSTNGFCRSLATVSASTITQAISIDDLAERIRRSTNAMEARYHKVNIAAFNRHKTVEFRQHSGTTDSRKTRMWIGICKKMVEAAKGNIAFGSVIDQPINTARRGSKAWQIGQMLLRPEGATGPEICAVMNWPSVSVPAQARAAGLDVYTQRTGRVVRYFVRRAPSQTPTNLDITIAGFCTVIGATDEERAYLEQRANNLRGPIAWAA